MLAIDFLPEFGSDPVQYSIRQSRFQVILYPISNFGVISSLSSREDLIQVRSTLIQKEYGGNLTRNRHILCGRAWYAKKELGDLQEQLTNINFAQPPLSPFLPLRWLRRPHSLPPTPPNHDKMAPFRQRNTKEEESGEGTNDRRNQRASESSSFFIPRQNCVSKSRFVAAQKIMWATARDAEGVCK